jgi:sugar O-acyltransferase (sialic acid O-acetyltransferase NeuD family)
VGTVDEIAIWVVRDRASPYFRKMQKLVIIGAGGFGREVLAWAGAIGGVWTIKGFLDDSAGVRGDSRLRAPVLGRVDDYAPESDDVFICAIGAPAMRHAMTEKIKKRGGRFVSIVHPTAVVADGVQLGEGVIVCPLSLVSADARVGDGVVVYYHSSVDHDAIVGPFTQISGHCDIMGAASVGAGVFLGSHAAIFPRVKVGDRAVVGAGAVVIDDVPDGMTVVGVPARSRTQG